MRRTREQIDAMMMEGLTPVYGADGEVVGWSFLNAEAAGRALVSAAPQMLAALKAAWFAIDPDTHPDQNRLVREAIDAAEGMGCAHQWVDARNSAIKSGEVCLLCHAIRPGNAL